MNARSFRGPSSTNHVHSEMSLNYLFLLRWVLLSVGCCNASKVLDNSFGVYSLSGTRFSTVGKKYVKAHPPTKLTRNLEAKTELYSRDKDRLVLSV